MKLYKWSFGGRVAYPFMMHVCFTLFTGKKDLIFIGNKSDEKTSNFILQSVSDNEPRPENLFTFTKFNKAMPF